MSAKNWSQCPKCLANKTIQKHEANQNLVNSYGVVSQEEYLKLLKEINNSTIVQDPSLREDYEIGIDNEGRFSVKYKASCSNCDFYYYHEYNKRVVELDKRHCGECGEYFYCDLQDNKNEFVWCPKCKLIK